MVSMPSTPYFRFIQFVLAPVLAMTILSAVFPRHAAARAPINHRLVVILDPGHGGSDAGASDPSQTVVEKTLALRVARAASVDLQHMGYRVFLTRTRDQSPNTPPRDVNHDKHIDHVDDLDARNLFANSHHGDVFVSIHFDGSSDSGIHGTHGYYCPDRPFHARNLELARTLTSSLPTALRQTGFKSPDNGIGTDVGDVVPQTRADYPWFLVLGPSLRHYVTGTAMPGALIETLYLSSPRDVAALRRPATISALGRGYAAGIRAFFHGKTRR